MFTNTNNSKAWLLATVLIIALLQSCAAVLHRTVFEGQQDVYKIEIEGNEFTDEAFLSSQFDSTALELCGNTDYRKEVTFGINRDLATLPPTKCRYARCYGEIDPYAAGVLQCHRPQQNPYKRIPPGTSVIDLATQEGQDTLKNFYTGMVTDDWVLKGFLEDFGQPTHIIPMDEMTMYLVYKNRAKTAAVFRYRTLYGHVLTKHIILVNFMPPNT